MQLLEVTHAVLNQPISVLVNQLFTWYYSENAKATILISTGSTTIPVLEKPDAIKMQIQKLQRADKEQARLLSEASVERPEQTLQRASSIEQTKGENTKNKKRGVRKSRFK